jgi:hypothetical protein
MKIILKTQQDPEQIKDLKYNSYNNTLQYNYNGKGFTVEIKESLNSYVKVENEDLEIISLEAKAPKQFYSCN